MRENTIKLIALALFLPTSLMAKSANMLVELCVNGSCYGTAFVHVSEGRVFVDEDALKWASVPLEGLPVETVGEKRFVDPSVKGGEVSLDASQGRLSVTMPASHFAGQAIDLDAHRTASKATTVPSLYVNYAVTAGTTATDRSIYLDAGFSSGRGLFLDNPSWNASQGLSRGLSRYEYDDTDRLRRLTVGDQYAYSSDGLGGTALFGGIGVVRAFDLDPYLVTFPRPTITGLLQAPGTVDIYKNGVLVARRDVAAGPFSVAGLGLGPGSNNISVVVHDSFGGVRTLQESFYSATQNLAQGLSDYALQLGIERSSTLESGYDSGRGVALLLQNYGVNDAVTAGYRIEAENSLLNAGSSVNLRLPFGFIGAGIAESRHRARAGRGTSFAYQFSGRRFSFGAGVQTYSSAYTRIGDRFLPAFGRPRRVDYVNAAWAPLALFSLQLAAGDIAYADGTRQRNASLSTSINLPGGMSLLLSANRQLNDPGGRDRQLFANLVIPLAGGSLGVNASRSPTGGSVIGASAQRSLPTDNGWGYSVSAQGSDGDLAQIEYQGSYGLLQVTGQRFAGQTSSSLLVSGSLVAMDDHVYAGRALQGGYTLVEAGMADVDITRENQSMGKTDSRGTLLVSNLLPYQANKIGIDQGSVPLTYGMGDTQQVVSVSRLGGSVVTFQVHALHAVRGNLTIDGKAVHYGQGAIAKDGESIRTLIGLDGAFYFPDLASGRYALRVDTDGGELTCRIDVPPGALPLTRLGDVACARSQGTLP